MHSTSRRPLFATVVLLATLAAALPAQEPIPAPLGDQFPALNEQSSWAQDIDQREWFAKSPQSPSDRPLRGLYPIGNGRIHAYCGLGEAANTLQAIGGLTHGFGDLSCELLDAEGRPVVLWMQRTRRVSGAGIVLTEDSSPTIALRTLAFAEVGYPRIQQLIEVRNLSDHPLTGLQLRLRSTTAKAVGEDGLGASRLSLPESILLRIKLQGGRAEGHSLLRQIDEIPPGAAWRASASVSIGTVLSFRAYEKPKLQTTEQAVGACLQHWQQRLAPTLQVDSDHRKLRDLVEDWKVRLLMQRDPVSGTFVPAMDRRRISVAENSGALIACLRLGLWDEAKDVLECWWDAARGSGQIRDDIPLLKLLEHGRERELPPGFWQGVRVHESSTAAWIVLQHFWYWRTTRDSELIENHWPLIDVCLKRQRRGRDEMVAFDRQPEWLRLAEACAGQTAEPSLWVANDPTIGRNAWSFENSVLFMMSIHAAGELVDALDQRRHPERWKDKAPETRPSEAYAKRAFQVMAAIEKRFWLEDEGRFAPAISPVTGEPHRAPLADAQLLPLWLGWTFPSGEKSRDNLRSSLAELWRRDGQLGSTPSVGYATGDLQGKLLVALSERNDARRMDALDKLLELAEPAGEWASFIGEDGRDLAWDGGEIFERGSPGIGGLNLDAILFAITGQRHVAVPNWDRDDIRLELRLPHGADFVTIRDSRKDHRRLDMFLRRVHEKLSAEELEANDKLREADRRDPEVEHERLRFVVEMLEGEPGKLYYDVGLDAAGTMFVRYLQDQAPEDPTKPDLRRIEEVEFAKADSGQFWPASDSRPAFNLPAPPPPGDAATSLVLTSRSRTAELMQADDLQVFDTGLPFDPTGLRAMLIDAQGRPTCARLFLDQGYDARPPATWTSWPAEDWRALLAEYAAAGGVVVEPGFVTTLHWQDEAGDWHDLQADDRSWLTVPATAERARFLHRATQAGDAVLRLGTDHGLSIELRGERVLDLDRKDAARARQQSVDALSSLVRLEAGANQFELSFAGSGERRIALRLTDADGWPLEPAD